MSSKFEDNIKELQQVLEELPQNLTDVLKDASKEDLKDPLVKPIQNLTDVFTQTARTFTRLFGGLSTSLLPFARLLGGGKSSLLRDMALVGAGGIVDSTLMAAALRRGGVGNVAAKLGMFAPREEFQRTLYKGLFQQFKEAAPGQASNLADIAAQMGPSNLTKNSRAALSRLYENYALTPGDKQGQRYWRNVIRDYEASAGHDFGKTEQLATFGRKDFKPMLGGIGSGLGTNEEGRNALRDILEMLGGGKVDFLHTLMKDLPQQSKAKYISNLFQGKELEDVVGATKKVKGGFLDLFGAMGKFGKVLMGAGGVLGITGLMHASEGAVRNNRRFFGWDMGITQALIGSDIQDMFRNMRIGQRTSATALTAINSRQEMLNSTEDVQVLWQNLRNTGSNIASGALQGLGNVIRYPARALNIVFEDAQVQMGLRDAAEVLAPAAVGGMFFGPPGFFIGLLVGVLAKIDNMLIQGSRDRVMEWSNAHRAYFGWNQVATQYGQPGAIIPPVALP